MLELNQLYNLDCMAGMAQFPDKYFDLAIVDPPYGIQVGHNIGRRKGQKPSSHKKAYWDEQPPPPEYFAELQRVSENQVIFGINHFVEQFHQNSAGWLVWDKLISEKTSFSMAEFIWTSFDRPAKIIRLSPTGGRNDEEKIVPSQKPVALYKQILQLCAQEGYKIIDTHTGSASSLIACYEYGLPFVGFELDPYNHKQAVERLQAYMAQTRLY